MTGALRRAKARKPRFDLANGMLGGLVHDRQPEPRRHATLPGTSRQIAIANMISDAASATVKLIVAGQRPECAQNNGLPQDRKLYGVFQFATRPSWWHTERGAGSPTTQFRPCCARVADGICLCPRRFAGILAATRERNMYASGLPDKRSVEGLPGCSMCSEEFTATQAGTGQVVRDWNPTASSARFMTIVLPEVYRQANETGGELFESRAKSEFPRILPDDVATERWRQTFWNGIPDILPFWCAVDAVVRRAGSGVSREIERTSGSLDRSSRINDDAAGSFTFASHGVADESRPEFGTSQIKGARRWGRGWRRAQASRRFCRERFVVRTGAGGTRAGLHVPDNVGGPRRGQRGAAVRNAHPPLSSIRIGAEQIVGRR